MSCIVSNHILYLYDNEIILKHTRPFTKTNECIFIMNSDSNLEYINTIIANRCSEINKATITINTNDNILDFIKLLGYTSVKSFKWDQNKLIYLDSRMI